MRTRPVYPTPASVSEDWQAELPDCEADVYKTCILELEAAYSMLSVSLNEAIGLHQDRRDQKAYQAICVTSDLCLLLTKQLEDLLRSMLLHAKHYGIVPNVVPLNSENFQGARSQRSARMNTLLNRVLLTQRSQFLHKISALQELVDDLGKDFAVVSEDLAGGAPLEPHRCWKSLDATHYDLNTCLREAIILFKSFLLALPEGQIRTFQKTIQAQSGFHASVPRTRPLRHRRMAPVAGQ